MSLRKFLVLLDQYNKHQKMIDSANNVNTLATPPKENNLTDEEHNAMVNQKLIYM